MVFVALVIDLAVADLGRVARLGEDHRDLAGLAQHGQRLVVETVALFGGLLAPELVARTVVLVEARRILRRQPRHLVLVRHPGVEVGGRGVVVEGAPGLVRQVILLEGDLLGAFGHLDAVAREILEQRAAVLLEIHSQASFQLIVRFGGM